MIQQSYNMILPLRVIGRNKETAVNCLKALVVDGKYILQNFFCQSLGEGGKGGGIVLLGLANYTVSGLRNKQWPLKRRLIQMERSWVTGSFPTLQWFSSHTFGNAEKLTNQQNP